MDDAAAERLYALALALIPDAAAAEEAFAAARDADDLQRRAAAWRAAHGLPPAPAEPELPALDGEEVAWALRRRRRVQRLRRLRPWLAATVAAPLLAALALRLLLPPPPPQGLAAAPAFARAPLARSDPRDGLRFSVYRVAAGPVTAEVWWDLSGPGAARTGRGLQPDLQRPADRRVFFAETTDTQADGPDRLLGHSVYHALVTVAGNVNVRLRQPGRRTAFSVSAAAEAADDALADRIAVDQSKDGNAWGVTLQEISLGAGYTAVRFQARGLRANSVLRPELYLGDGTPLGWQGYWLLGGGGAESVAVFDPLPPGRRLLTVHFPAPQDAAVHVEVVRLPAPDRVLDLQRQGGTLTATFLLPATQNLAGPVSLTGSGAATYRAILTPLRSDDQGWHSFLLRADDLPADFTPQLVLVPVLQSESPLDFTIALPG